MSTTSIDYRLGYSDGYKDATEGHEYNLEGISPAETIGYDDGYRDGSSVVLVDKSDHLVYNRLIN